MAVLLQMTANINRDPRQRPQPFEVDEVLGWLGYPPEAAPPVSVPTVEQLKARVSLLHGVYTNGSSMPRHTEA